MLSLTLTGLKNHLKPSVYWLPELIARASIFKSLHVRIYIYDRMCKKKCRMGWMNMQIQSLTVGGACRKAEIQWLLQYTTVLHNFLFLTPLVIKKKWTQTSFKQPFRFLYSLWCSSYNTKYKCTQVFWIYPLLFTAV